MKQEETGRIGSADPSGVPSGSSPVPGLEQSRSSDCAYAAAIIFFAKGKVGVAMGSSLVSPEEALGSAVRHAEAGDSKAQLSSHLIIKIPLAEETDHA